MLRYLVICLCLCLMAGCGKVDEVEQAENQKVQKQQAQYNTAQPVPFFDFSLERDVAIQLYRARNETVATHTVWRSDYGMIEGDTPSIGYPIPYDVQLTNPEKIAIIKNGSHGYMDGVVGQAEPNGLWSSRASIATWIRSVRDGVECPIYVEGKVTCYPYPVVVDYETNRVTPVPGAVPSVIIKKNQ